MPAITATGSVKQEDCGRSQPEQKARPYFQTNQSKRTAGVAPASKCKAEFKPTFKPQSHQKKKKKNKKNK
jgi:hypothetical protein